MPELLIELGCEELPASFVARACSQLEKEIINRLIKANITFGTTQFLGTPRRLIVQICDVQEHQPNNEKQQRGPSLKACYNSLGEPTQALIGFCRSQDIEISDIFQDGHYIWINKKIAGRPTKVLLPEILYTSIKALTFDKAMTWGSSKMRFARPIRWILASFQNELVSFEIDTIQSGLQSFGRRYQTGADANGKSFEVTNFDDLLQKLREHEVEPDFKIREKIIRETALKASSENIQLSDALVEENVFLTEWPNALEGHFKKAFLYLPEPVLTTVMAKHQRYFPICDSQGKITNKFISIRNGGEESTVRKGNEWVLNSRFNDANFFYQEDLKRSLHEFLSKTDQIIFQDKLGSIRQRADRIAILCEQLAIQDNAPKEDIQYAIQAGLYCKADLSSGLVTELPSLQGIIGGEYAKNEKFPQKVYDGISFHYNLAKAQTTKTATYVLIADQIDKLTGYLGLNLIPTGSSDPFALRRAVTYLILINQQLNAKSSQYLNLFEYAFKQYEIQGIKLDKLKAFEHLKNIFNSRYRALMKLEEDSITFEENTEPLRIDILNATLSNISLENLLDPQNIRMRAYILHLCTADPFYLKFVQSAIRTINIVQAGIKKDIIIPEFIGFLDSKEADHLKDAFQKILQSTSRAIKAKKPEFVLETLIQLEGPIYEFFEKTMVMVEDTNIRGARLALLKHCSDLMLLAGDFSALNV